ncbi:MAG: hypothetical protein V4819_14220 [Verrucomicrobiota bacterium]
MKIVWTEIQWLVPGLLVLAAVAIGLFFSYRRKHSMPVGVRWLAGSLKWIGFVFLLGFILRPEVVRSFNRPGTNHWAVLLDTSASMTLKDQSGSRSRADRLNEIIRPDPDGWQKKLAADFVVDSFTFDVRLGKPTEDTPLSFDGPGSALARALGDLRDRYQGRPLAGILVITDGSPTDSAAIDSKLHGLPRTFPLVLAPEQSLVDLSVNAAVAQATLFEDAPVMVDATIAARGVVGQTVVATVREHGGKLLGQERKVISKEDETWIARFQVRPEEIGTAFFDVEVALENSGDLQEATLENNRRIVAANRDTGPYRVLYLGGRPNYEHKFLKRALEEDPEVRVTSLIRIARREPKFDYRSRAGERSNPLYRGFEAQEEAERFDEPVFIRMNQKDGELAAGFPKTPAELFPFDTVIIDDVEAAFFDREQQRLLQRFVSERGGSVIMLGGAESLDTGGYNGTPIGEMLPVYLDPATPAGAPVAGRLNLTREGRLEPWARLRATDDDEARRIEAMPEFQNVHRLPALRPGATEIGKLELAEGSSPALAVRRYGRGRTAVLAIGDLWRWGLRGPEDRADLDKTWRQTTRWLLADVPRPLAVKAESAAGGQMVTTELLGDDFQPDEAGGVTLRVRRPDGTWTSISPRPHASKAGTLEALHTATEPGPYLAEAITRAADGKPALTARTGWVVNALRDEYLAIKPDMAAMNRLATATGGRILTPDGLDEFIAGLKDLPMPVTETRSEPLWHSPIWLAVALACFIGEWSLRRWKKLP